MADLSITPANVVPSTTNFARGIAGAAISAGDALKIDTANNNKLALASNDTEANSIVEGIAVCDAAADQPVNYVKQDQGLDLGATLTVGETYVLSASGAIAPIGDLTSGDYVSIIGVASATDSIKLSIFSSKVSK